MSLYTALPALASLYGRMIVDTLHERVGEEEQLRGRQSPDDDDDFNGVWGRIIYMGGERRGGDSGVYSEHGPQFDYELWAFQAGVDIYRREHDNGVRDHAGLYGAIGHAKADVHHIVTNRFAGEDFIRAYSLGAYWTRFSREGGYLDGVAQFSWFDGEARSLRLPVLEGDAEAFALSLEGGQPFVLKDKWIVEPQGQLIYQHFFGGDAEDAGGRLRFEDTDSLVGRLGVRLHRTWRNQTEGGEERLTTGWGRVNIWREFMDQPRTVFETESGPVAFKSHTGETWLELNGGFTTQISERGVAYLNGSYLWDTDDRGHAVSVKAGVRFNW